MGKYHMPVNGENVLGGMAYKNIATMTFRSEVFDCGCHNCHIGWQRSLVPFEQ